MLASSPKLNKARLEQIISILLLALNAIGALVYLKRASISWAIPQEQGLHVVAGEPFVWAAAILPIIVPFFLLNLTWGGIIVFNNLAYAV